MPESGLLLLMEGNVLLHHAGIVLIISDLGRGGTRIDSKNIIVQNRNLPMDLYTMLALAGIAYKLLIYS